MVSPAENIVWNYKIPFHIAIGIIESKGVRSVSQKMRQLMGNVRLGFDYLRMTENSWGRCLQR